MPTVIQVSNLSKSYRLGAIGSRTLSEDLNRWWARLRKQPDPYLRIGQEHLAEHMGERIWALKDINFEVQQGEALGIIGRNGAGKSTLLKILSRITAPTTGEVRVKGRIASLLEVGTGFHPELTGRENIFLNGAILGMKKPEIERKFDEIVDFAGVEKFIDTPVKRYSSGMYVRLAFAVAAHLDPEILVVDEVLAVGDAEFQKKCLGKMGEVAGEGRTVLFVSHNMGAINSLCANAILLKNGSMDMIGPTEQIVNSYLSTISERINSDSFVADTQEFSLEEFKVFQIGIDDPRLFVTDKELYIEFSYSIKKDVHGLRIGFDIITKDGVLLLRSFDDDIFGKLQKNTGTFKAKCVIPPLFFSPSKYMVSPRITIHRMKWIYNGEYGIEISFYNSNGVNCRYDDSRPGIIMPGFEWEITSIK